MTKSRACTNSGRGVMERDGIYGMKQGGHAQKRADAGDMMDGDGDEGGRMIVFSYGTY